MGRSTFGRRLLLGVVTAAAVACAAATPARADRAFGILPGNQLITFDTASPTAVTQLAITGLGANQTVRGIDARISNGQLYVVTVTTGSAANSVVFTYTVNPDTGAASFVGQTAAALAGAADVPTGWDVNSTASDRTRYVNTNDENARINLDNGALAANDVDLTPAATSTIIAAAYATNTLYLIDRNDSVLARQGGVGAVPSANGGVVTDLAPLGFTLNAANDGGFDISPTGELFAALTNAADNLTRLYSFTAAGEAVSVGLIGNGLTEVRSLTILPVPPAAPPVIQPTPDRTSPVVLVALSRASARLGRLSRRGFAYDVSCSEACTATGSISADVPARKSRRTTLASGTVKLAGAGKARVTVKASTAGRRAIRRLRRGKRRRVKATLTTVATDSAGNSTTIRKRLTLIR
jgi:Domain of unknown function (DUF4394)